jgi:hypothetical protein
MMSVLFFTSVCCILLLVTISGMEAFPFSHYPMFSALYDAKNVKVFRIALEKRNGETVWWKSRFYRYPEQLGNKMKALYSQSGVNKTRQTFLILERDRLLLEVFRLMKQEGYNTEEYSSIHITELSVGKDLCIIKNTIDIIELGKLRHGQNI